MTRTRRGSAPPTSRLQRTAETLAAQEHRPQRGRSAPRHHRRPPQHHAPQAPRLGLSPQRLCCPQSQPPVELALLQWRAEQLPGQTTSTHRPMRLLSLPSMEGRAIARPNWRRRTYSVAYSPPSMEGRAIARPNLEGPMGAGKTALGLQWRAEQLPGQTRASTGSTRRRDDDLQWRAEQLPGQTSDSHWSASAHSAFNGGPSNCPAKPASASCWA